MAYEGLVIAEPSLAYYWPLGDASGTAAADVKDSNPGTYHGAVTLGQPGLLGSSYTATLFSSGTAWVETDLGNNISTTGSVELWYKTTGSGSYMIIGQNGVSGAPGQWNEGLYIDGSGHLTFYCYPLNTALADSTTSNDGQFHHAVGTWDGGNPLLLYRDGAQVGSSAGGGMQTITPGYWRLGEVNGGNRFTGTIAHAAVYTTALSAARIAAHYVAATLLSATLSVADPTRQRIPGIY